MGGAFSPDALITRLDANANGILEPSETEGRARGFVERFASGAGLDINQPIPIEKLKEALQKRMSGQQPGGGDGQQGGEAQPQQPQPAGEGQTVVLLIPGFGASVPGFGEASMSPVAIAAAEGDGEGAGEQAAAPAAGAGFSDASPEEKNRMFAQSLIKQHDANGDGVLQKDEWAKVREAEKYDSNGDDRLTEDEVFKYLTAYAQGGGGGGENGGGRRGGSGGGGRNLVRFMTPIERLPKGLPPTFLRNDANGDGQVSMAEFSSSWTDAKAAEFAKQDLNGDGFVTPAEALGDKRPAATDSASNE